MNKQSVVRVALGLSSLCIFLSSANAAPSITSGLVAAYEFTGNLNDSIGSNTGTNHGATLTSDRNGTANSAYSFSGASQYISITTPSISNPITLDFWVNPTSLSNDMRIISNIDGSTTGNTFSIRYYSGHLEIWNNTWQAISSSTLALNTWTNVAVTIENNKATGFINGVEELTATDSTNYRIDTLGIGALFEMAHGQYFNGKIDDVYLYSRVLNNGEIAAISSPVPEPSSLLFFTAGISFITLRKRNKLIKCI